LRPSLTFELRNYQPGDENQIIDLFNAAFGQNNFFTPRTVEFWIWRYLKKPGFDPKGIFLAEKEDRIISSVVETMRKAKFGEKTLHLGVIDDVSTQPELWGKGLASKLLEEAIKYAEQKKLDGLALFADPEGNARKIYLSHGFVDTKRFHFYTKILYQKEPQENLKDFTEKFNRAYSRFEGFHPLSIDELSWKLLEPSKVFPSETWIAKKEEGIIGGGTLRIRKIIAYGTELNSALLENVFTLDRNDMNTAKNVLLKLVDQARAKECPIALSIISSNCDFESKLLESTGFAKVSDEVEMIRCSEFDFTPSAKHCWYAPYEHMI
jgi:GNAT superfamily N-acetyltransferase